MSDKDESLEKAVEKLIHAAYAPYARFNIVAAVLMSIFAVICFYKACHP